MRTCNPRDYLPDVQDGLTHRERIVLQCLYALQQERIGRNIPMSLHHRSRLPRYPQGWKRIPQ
jgi:hypothetical protein